MRNASVSYCWCLPPLLLSRSVFLGWDVSKTIRASNFKICHIAALDCHCIFERKWRHDLLLVSSKTHKRARLRSCSGRHFTITVQSISKKVYCFANGDSRGTSFSTCCVFHLTFFALWPRKWGSSGPTVIYALHRWLMIPNTVSLNLKMWLIWSCIGHWITSNNKQFDSVLRIALGNFHIEWHSVLPYTNKLGTKCDQHLLDQQYSSFFKFPSVRLFTL